jgi:hypothetical protein
MEVRGRGERRGERGEGTMNKRNQQTTVPGADYTAAWTDHRNRCRWCFGISLGGLAFISVVFILSPFEAIREVEVGILIPIWFVASIVAAFRASWFTCPRCGQRFFATWWYHNGFARRCVHCRLRKWAKNDSPEEDS